MIYFLEGMRMSNWPKYRVVLTPQLNRTLGELALQSKIPPSHFVQQLVESELASRRLPEASTGGAQLRGSSDVGQKISKGQKLRWAARRAQISL